MEISTILTADILDILFDGRNKEYGAYDLRRTYKRRLTLSITVMLSVICLLFIGFAFAGKKKEIDPLFIKDHELIAVTIPEPVEPLPPPPPQKITPPPPQVQTIRVTPPVIVPDDQVQPDDKPPVNADLDNVKIGNITQDGKLDDGTVIAPPGDGDGKVIELPKKEEEDWNKTFTKVEMESEYPGGPRAWQRFLRDNLRFPDEAADAGVEGFVVVQFIVDVEGNVSDVVAVSGPQELRAEAIRVIKRSGKWTPAIQNGHKVKSYKKQPLGFKLGTE
ncbi:MAG TPA: energy transducer TonB [Niastella sp.]